MPQTPHEQTPGNEEPDLIIASTLADVATDYAASVEEGAAIAYTSGDVDFGRKSVIFSANMALNDTPVEMRSYRSGIALAHLLLDRLARGNGRTLPVVPSGKEPGAKATRDFVTSLQRDIDRIIRRDGGLDTYAHAERAALSYVAPELTLALDGLCDIMEQHLAIVEPGATADEIARYRASMICGYVFSCKLNDFALQVASNSQRWSMN